MAEPSPLSEKEQRRRSAAALFLKVHDLSLDEAAGAPVTRLCNLMITEGFLTNVDGLRVCAATAEGARVQYHRDRAWTEVMRLPAQVQVAVINRLKVMANLDVAKRSLQEGMLKVRLRGQVLVVGIAVRLHGDSEEATLDLPPRAGEAAAGS